MIQKIFRRRHFIFGGRRKKLPIRVHLEGCEVVPIQALTAIVYTAAGILSFYIFLKGYVAVALILALIVTQNWRFASEFLRADYRGNGIFSAYQIMSLAAMAYLLLIALIFPVSPEKMPNLAAGLQSLWHPGWIILLAGLGVVCFIYSGKSEVTCSTIDIYVAEKKI